MPFSVPCKDNHASKDLDITEYLHCVECDLSKRKSLVFRIALPQARKPSVFLVLAEEGKVKQIRLLFSSV